MTKIKELFTSIQGEGPFVGYKQLFIRLCGCNLSCNYCDTDFDATNSKDYSINEIIDIVNQNKDCHSISITGGEPLLHAPFIRELFANVSLPIYLETNGTLVEKLKEVIDCLEFIAADIKLPSCSGVASGFDNFDNFLAVAKQKYTFAKVVFDTKITDEEIFQICSICRKHSIELILQPMMLNNTPSVSADFMLEILNKCLKLYGKVRLIPQIHKFINVI